MQPRHFLLLLATLIIAISGLIYELLLGTLSSYLLGDSVYQFSIVIGLFMSAMGIGAYLSRFIHQALEHHFVVIQISLAVIGGFSALILFYAFAYLDNYWTFLLLICLLIGSLVGLEIPLITRILQQYQSLKGNISNVLTADYIGALLAALLFPMVLVPQLGLLSTGLVFGLLNLAVAGLAVFLFQTRLSQLKTLIALIGMVGLSLLLSLFYQQTLMDGIQQRLYGNNIILSKTTPYQRLVLTRQGKHIRLYINQGLQFDSLDEYRYHESLVHPVMLQSKRHDQVLVLGGGDGMAVREVLKYDEVKHITLVDLDPEMTRLFKHNPLLRQLNHNSLNDAKVKTINADAWQFIQQSQQLYDVIIIDLPDPHNPSLSKLYSRAFYQHLENHLTATGAIVTQATSPFFARQAFWCIHATMSAVQNPYSQQTLHTQAYHSYVPSFGEWGFVLASRHHIDWQQRPLPDDLQYLNDDVQKTMHQFPPDMQSLEVEVNTLISHDLLNYYEKGWNQWYSAN